MVTAKKHKRVLITSGPTWVGIDKVRVISNIATGAGGISLANKLQRKGYKVTLLLGPVAAGQINKKVRVVRYRFFDELKKALKKELRKTTYHWAVHSAAVSDFRPRQANTGKIKSARKKLLLELIPTEKLVCLFKKIQPKLKLVIFKL